jgi:hypothetical protein
LVWVTHGISQEAFAEKAGVHQVASIQVQQIESVERWTPFAVKQFIENAAPFGIQAHEFAINHCVFYFKPGQMAAKLSKTLVRVSPTRNQFTLSVPNVRQRPKAIVLQFEKEIRMIERPDERGSIWRCPFGVGAYK